MGRPPAALALLAASLVLGAATGCRRAEGPKGILIGLIVVVAVAVDRRRHAQGDSE